jgi:hypothetical protein
MPAKLPIRPENHYRAQLVFLRLLGLGEWLRMSGAARGGAQNWAVSALIAAAAAAAH